MEGVAVGRTDGRLVQKEGITGLVPGDFWNVRD